MTYSLPQTECDISRYRRRGLDEDSLALVLTSLERLHAADGPPDRLFK